MRSISFKCGQNKEDKLKRHCIDNFGFMVKSNMIAKAKSMLIIGNKTKKEYFKECNSVNFYDLTLHDNLSTDMRTLLGLGPKFHIEPSRVKIINTIKMTHRFKRDVILLDYLLSNFIEKDEEIPRLCRRNEKWQPPKDIVLT